MKTLQRVQKLDSIFHNAIRSQLLSNAAVSRNQARRVYTLDPINLNEARFDKLLIANRGEIACRIISTAKKMGIKTVAVYSIVDAQSKHVKLADEAILIGGPRVSESYLNVNKILAAIGATGAQAVHPGYGFLSENAGFVELLEKADIAFIGPSSQSITKMGDKLESKRLAMEAGVNTVPGFDGVITDEEHCVKIAKEIGYPVMIKASAGGGGMGMRIARNDKDAREGFRVATREAISSFADNRILLEKYVENPRHIEIQVLGDKHGNAVHFYERECSIQRRHQKVIEEAPSTFLDETTREGMGAQAVALCKRIGYHSAGTVEFLIDAKRNFYFLEMNTRLQVEHPITECITGVDLVQQMLRVAKGHPLNIQQADIRISGWAIESRVYAEDPYKNFGTPSIGKLYAYQEPLNINFEGGGIDGKRKVFNGNKTGMGEGNDGRSTDIKLIRRGDQIERGSGNTDAIDGKPGDKRNGAIGMNGEYEQSDFVNVRCDSGIEEGSEISIYYDAMISKLICHGVDRADAIKKSVRALDSYVIRGVTHNIPLLRDILTESRFNNGDISTNYLTEVYGAKFENRDLRPMDRINLLSVGAALYAFWRTKNRKYLPHARIREFERTQWDLVAELSDWKYYLKIADYTPAEITVEIDSSTYVIANNFNLSNPIIEADINGDVIIMQLLAKSPNGEFQIIYKGAVYKLKILPKAAVDLYHHIKVKPKKDFSKLICSPMPGLVKSVSCKKGDRVVNGEELCVIEAMKMQNSMCSATNGVVKSVNIKEGDAVGEDDILVELE